LRLVQSNTRARAPACNRKKKGSTCRGDLMLLA
jgi:hypothetical protein